MESQRPSVGQAVIWLQQRKWGGKQNVPATFQCMARNGLSRASAVIKIDGNGEKTVRLSSLRWAAHDGLTLRCPARAKPRRVYCGHCDEYTDHSTVNCVLPIVN